MPAAKGDGAARKQPKPNLYILYNVDADGNVQFHLTRRANEALEGVAGDGDYAGWKLYQQRIR